MYFKSSIISDQKSSNTYNHFHNILRLFDILPNFLFIASESMRSYYLSTRYIRVPSSVAEQQAFVPTQEKNNLGS